MFKVYGFSFCLIISVILYMDMFEGIWILIGLESEVMFLKEMLYKFSMM